MDISRKNPNRKKALIGRGGKRGKTSGRGTKGQKARAGRKLRPEFRDIIKKLPKKRGYGKNRSHTVNSSKLNAAPINLGSINKVFNDGDIVNPITLAEKKLLKTVSGRTPKVKILGTGELTKKLTIEGCLISKSVLEKVEKAGGKIS